MDQHGHTRIYQTHIWQWKLFSMPRKLLGVKRTIFRLDWQAAISFVSKCQNLSQSNTEEWVSTHKEDHGGFVYFPGKSMAGERTDENGTVSIRSLEV